MLSRAAANMFWMARYLERAESTARLLTMGQRMAVLPGSVYRDEWRSVLRVTGCEHLVEGSAAITEADIVRLLVLDAENGCSIQASLAMARANAKSVRTALTQDMWEAMNDDWRRLESYDIADARRELPAIIDWVKARASNFRGAAETGLLRNAGYSFLRIGSALERALMTLRLLDVKYYVLLPETEVVGGGRDHYQWTSVLYALSGERAYHHIYAGAYSPWQITDFLMVNRAFPRSVAYCVGQLRTHLDRLATAHGAQAAAHETVAALDAHLETNADGQMFAIGLHESVQHALATLNRLGQEIAEAYHFE